MSRLAALSARFHGLHRRRPQHRRQRFLREEREQAQEANGDRRRDHALRERQRGGEEAEIGGSQRKTTGIGMHGA